MKKTWKPFKHESPSSYKRISRHRLKISRCQYTLRKSKACLIRWRRFAKTLSTSKITESCKLMRFKHTQANSTASPISSAESRSLNPPKSISRFYSQRWRDSRKCSTNLAPVKVANWSSRTERTPGLPNSRILGSTSWGSKKSSKSLRRSAFPFRSCYLTKSVLARKRRISLKL